MSPIPGFKQSGVLPPYEGPQHLSSLTTRDPRISPYPTTLSAVKETLGTSLERKRILLGFLKFREALRGYELPLDGSFMWLDGSFCEEPTAREPQDLDVVVFFVVPTEEALANRQMTSAAFEERANAMQAELFKRSDPKDAPDGVWATYRCDVAPVWLDREAPQGSVQDVVYWYGLLSHRRGTQEWKGMLRVRMDEPEEAALRAQLEAEIGEVAR